MLVPVVVKKPHVIKTIITFSNGTSHVLNALNIYGNQDNASNNYNAINPYKDREYINAYRMCTSLL